MPAEAPNLIVRFLGLRFTAAWLGFNDRDLEIQSISLTQKGDQTEPEYLRMEKSIRQPVSGKRLRD